MNTEKADVAPYDLTPSSVDARIFMDRFVAQFCEMQYNNTTLFVSIFLLRNQQYISEICHVILSRRYYCSSISVQLNNHEFDKKNTKNTEIFL